MRFLASDERLRHERHRSTHRSNAGRGLPPDVAFQKLKRVRALTRAVQELALRTSGVGTRTRTSGSRRSASHRAGSSRN